MAVMAVRHDQVSDTVVGSAILAYSQAITRTERSPCRAWMLTPSSCYETRFTRTAPRIHRSMTLDAILQPPSSACPPSNSP